MGTPFWKMHGAGNDFLLFDDRQCLFPADSHKTIAALCARRLGIGSEGLILIRPSTIADFKMCFFNPDGHEVDMCGNGTRCVAKLACDLKIVGSNMTIETRAGIMSAEVQRHAVQLGMPPPTNIRDQQSIALPDGTTHAYWFMNTGVPHAIITTDTLEDIPVIAYGKAIRNHAAFSPAGTNVNFVAITGNQSIQVRTYERGVEDETLVCGTGITASAIAAAMQGFVHAPVSVLAKSGDLLVVDFTIAGTTVSDLTLTGPTETVFSGECNINT
jgi:diaminopimelate epimerase